MRLNCTYAAAIVALLWMACPTQAHAQYRNSSIGLDIGYMLVTQPSIIDPATNAAIASPDGRGDRLTRGFRFGGEGNFKLHQDHWWFDARLALNFPTINNPPISRTDADSVSDRNANATLGTIMGLEGLAGVRYYLWTDHVRPYVQAALSYSHIWTFGSGAGTTCDSSTGGGLCVQSSTNAAAFLPHVNLFGVHVTPGFEFVVVKDFALHMFFDFEHSFNFQAAGNNIVTFGLGVLFYS